jgi:hypothetical protein
VDGSPRSAGLGFTWPSRARSPDPLSGDLSYVNDPERSVERFLLESGRDQLSAVEIMAPGRDPGATSSAEAAQTE